MPKKSIGIIILSLIAFALLTGGVILWQYLKNKKSAEEQPKEETAEQTEEETEEPIRNLVALGDSLTNAAGLSQTLKGDNKEYSFATGRKIKSFYLGLKNDYGENLKPFNLAISGAKSIDLLKKQVPKVVPLNPKYITLLIGGNDFKGRVPADTFKANLEKIAKGIKAKDRVVFIANLPNYIDIRTSAYPSCAKYNVSEELETLAAAQLQLYNYIIKLVAENNDFILVDLYSTLKSKHLSPYDCTHFSIEGQKKVAEEFLKVYKKKIE